MLKILYNGDLRAGVTTNGLKSTSKKKTPDSRLSYPSVSPFVPVIPAQRTKPGGSGFVFARTEGFAPKEARACVPGLHCLTFCVPGF